MRCGSILVKGEAEEMVDSPRPRSRQGHGRRSNPFSTSGLDKFQSVSADLSARRERMAKETGVPESMVRFEYSKMGWTPFVVINGEVMRKENSGWATAGVSILGPAEINNGEKDGELMRKDKRNLINGESEGISISLLDERSHGLVMPWFWILKAFGVLSLSAISVRRSGVPAATAMSIGGVVCMKKFVLSGVLCSSQLSRNPGNPHTSHNVDGVEANKEKTDIDKVSIISPTPDLDANAIAAGSFWGSHIQPIEFMASDSPKAKEANDKHKRHHHSKTKGKTFRIVPLDNRPTAPATAQGPNSFYRRTRPAMASDASAVATAMIITLFCLAFYGRLSAIFFTSAWWYVRSMFLHYSEKMNRKNNNMQATSRNR